MFCLAIGIGEMSFNSCYILIGGSYVFSGISIFFWPISDFEETGTGPSPCSSIDFSVITLLGFDAA